MAAWATVYPPYIYPPWGACGVYLDPSHMQVGDCIPSVHPPRGVIPRPLPHGVPRIASGGRGAACHRSKTPPPSISN
eukprot:3423630-Pyramimonas_sp.AAC.1